MATRSQLSSCQLDRQLDSDLAGTQSDLAAPTSWPLTRSPQPQPHTETKAHIAEHTSMHASTHRHTQAHSGSQAHSIDGTQGVASVCCLGQPSLSYVGTHTDTDTNICCYCLCCCRRWLVLLIALLLVLAACIAVASAACIYHCCCIFCCCCPHTHTLSTHLTHSHIVPPHLCATAHSRGCGCSHACTWGGGFRLVSVHVQCMLSACTHLGKPCILQRTVFAAACANAGPLWLLLRPS